MSSKHISRRLLLTVLMSMIVLLAAGAGAYAAAPIKEIPASRWGREVNLTKVGEHAGAALEDVCTVESDDTCQIGAESTITGGFTGPDGIATGPAPGDGVYVSDVGGDRVQEFSPNGEFILEFGKGVDQSTGANICTAASHDVCRGGTKGSGPGEFEYPGSIAVDQETGNVYVQDYVNWRVQEFTASGEFVLTFGKDVNETTGANVCTEQEIKNSGVKCKAGVQETEGGEEPSSFRFLGAGPYQLLGVGPNHTVYVGDEHRVQEFEEDGEFKTEIPLSSLSSALGNHVIALAVDTAGNTYLVYETGSATQAIVNTIYKFDPSGKEVTTAPYPLTENARDSKATELDLKIIGLALDPAGRLAVTEREYFYDPSTESYIENLRGGLYVAATGKLISEFANPNIRSETFDAADRLYVAVNVSAAEAAGNEVFAYAPVPIAELVTGAAPCVPGVDRGTDVTLDCVLQGAADPEGVSETEAWFQWGGTQGFGETTVKQPVAEAKTVTAAVEGLKPNDVLYYRLVGNDRNAPPPELLTGEISSFTTPSVPPRIEGEASASYVGASSVVLFGELNPEHASTRYTFQYGACESLDACPERGELAGLESAAYEKIATTSGVSGLQPVTTYHYRLVAVNEKGQEAKGPEGQFTTAPSAKVQAATGAPSTISATGASISGTVDPDGQAATYAFELGVYEGPETRYGVLVSDSTAGTPITESFGVSGLQPGTTYAYRVKIKSGYGEAMGEPVLFTTEGLPSVLALPASLGMLTVPSIKFPAQPAESTTPKKLTRAQQLARALKACNLKAKSKRAACRRNAHKKYAPKGAKGNKQ